MKLLMEGLPNKQVDDQKDLPISCNPVYGFISLNCFTGFLHHQLFYSCLFSFLQAYIYIYIDGMINMIKSCQEDPFCPLLKDFAILSFFQIASSGVCGWPLATKQQL